MTSAMDQLLPKPSTNYRMVAFGVLASLGGVAAVSQLIPRGLRVEEGDIRIATAAQAMFRNDILVRSTVAPLHTVMLDALESGRVEEILAADGAVVNRGDLLFRLSNPRLRLELVAREADRAQQISNLSNVRVALEAAATDHQRRMLDLKVALAQTERQHERYLALIDKGYISQATLQDSQGRLEQQRQSVDDEKKRAAIEMRIKRDGIRRMAQAVERLDAGLKVVNDSIDGLTVRAPIAGRLTDFSLQLGEIIKPDQRIGRIDDPNRFKLTAQIDEYFLGNIALDKHGMVSANGREFPVKITQVLPQIKDGRFSVELSFTDESPTGIKPGQSLETRITLGATSPALILPNDAFLGDSSGQWVFVVARDGTTAERRNVRMGRRNNDQVEVTSGLSPGERVIVSAYSAFGNAQKLQIKK